MKTVTAIWSWLEGKKTYVAAALMFAIGVYGLWTGAISSENAGALITAAFGIAGLGSKSNRALQIITEFIEAEKAKGKASGK